VRTGSCVRLVESDGVRKASGDVRRSDALNGREVLVMDESGGGLQGNVIIAVV